MAIARPKLRADLTHDRHDDGERAVTFLKDPIRSSFYELSDLQVALAELFDGSRSVEEVAERLAAESGVEVSAARVGRFAAFLADHHLLDVTCYEASPPRTRRDAMRLLRRRGVRLRRRGEAGGRRRDEARAALFEAGVRDLARGRCTQAARAFAALLEQDPADGRARAVLDAIRTAFFRQFRRGPSHMRMVHLWNPDRFLGWLDARLGRILFSRWGVLLLALSVAAAAAIAPDLRPPAVEAIAWGQVLLAPFVIGVTTLFLHELGHGLACKHYGGKVESMGIMLFYGVIPGAYCDVTEVHRLRSRWHKVVVYSAGVLVEIPVLCLWLCCYHLSAESFALRPAILVWITYDAYLVLRNVVPLVKGYDGYYALTSFLDLPDLAERAFAHARGLAAERLLGVPAAGAPASARERRAFLLFAAASALYYAGFYYGIWFRFLFPLASRLLGAPGLALALLYAYRVVGRKALRATVAFARFLWRERQRVFTLRRGAAFAAAAAGAIALLAAPYRNWADGEFVVRPRRVGAVRAPEPGLVASVAVREGARLREGDVVATLDDSDLAFRERALDEEIASARLALAAVEGGEREERVAVFAARAERERAVAAIASASARDARRLNALGLLAGARLDALAGAAAAASSEALVARRALELSRAPGRREDVAEARARLRELERARDEVRARRAAMVLRSPNDGVVVGARLGERLHQRLERGDALCEVHEVGAMRAEVTLGPGELLSDVSPGAELLMRPAGDPGRAVRARLAEVQPRVDPRAAVRARSAEVANPGWPSGLSGHARVYGPPRSIAYHFVGGPLLQLLDFTLWSHLH